MLHTAALIASVASLAIVCAIYYCNVLSGPGSWFRSELPAMILLSLLTGIFPAALVGGIVGLWGIAAGGGANALLSAGADLVALACVAAAALVFRAIVRATYRSGHGPNNVTPLVPRPPAPPQGRVPARKAA